MSRLREGACAILMAVPVGLLATSIVLVGGVWHLFHRHKFVTDMFDRSRGMNCFKQRCECGASRWSADTESKLFGYLKD